LFGNYMVFLRSYFIISLTIMHLEVKMEIGIYSKEKTYDYFEPYLVTDYD